MSGESIAPLRAGVGGIVTEQLDTLPASGVEYVGVDSTGKLTHSAITMPTRASLGLATTDAVVFAGVTAAGLNLTAGSPTSNGVGMEGAGSWVTVYTNGQKRWRMKYADSIQSTLNPIDFMSSHDFSNATLQARIKPTATQVELHASNGVAIKAINGTTNAPIAASSLTLGTSAVANGAVLLHTAVGTTVAMTAGNESLKIAGSYTGFAEIRPNGNGASAFVGNLGTIVATISNEPIKFQFGIDSGNSHGAFSIAPSGVSGGGAVRFRNLLNTADADLTAGAITASGGTFTFGPNAWRLVDNGGGVYLSDSLGNVFFAASLSGGGEAYIKSGYLALCGINGSNPNVYIDSTTQDVVQFLKRDASPTAKIVAGVASFSGAVTVGVYTFATVPAAASNTGATIRISDRAQRQAYSDGSNWRFFADDSVIS